MSKIILRPIDFTLVATQSIATGSYALGFDLGGDLVKKDRDGGIYRIGTSSFGYTSSGIYQIDNTPILTYTYVNTIDLNNRIFYGSTGSTVASWSSNSNDGISYDSNYVTNFTTYSLVTKGYVDLAVVSAGLTATNGLTEIATNVVALGGTLSQNTTINAAGYDLVIGDVDNLMFTTSIFDVNAELIIIDAGTGSADIYADAGISLISIGGVNIVTNNNIVLSATAGVITTTGLKGLVYAADYGGTFVTHSLVDKGYVDLAVISAGLTATNGLTEIATNVVALGGNLIQNTIIDGAFDLYLGQAANELTRLAAYATDIYAVGATSISFIANNITSMYMDPVGFYLQTLGTYSMIASAVDIRGLADFNIEAATTLTIDGQEISLLSGGAVGLNLYVAAQTIANNGTDNHSVVTDLQASKGLVYATDYSAAFTPESLVSKRYVDLAVVSAGLTATNGLTEIYTNVVALGGTLSQNTTINAAGYDLIISDVGNLMFTASIFDVSAELVVIDAGIGSADIYADAGISLISIGGDINITSNNNIVLSATAGDVTTTGLKGLVYTTDYSTTFVTHSLIDKAYVDAAILVGSGTPVYLQMSLTPTGGFINLDGESTGLTITSTPNDSTRVQVFVNGSSQRVGDGASASVDCYFGNIAGTPLTISSIVATNILYWNAVTAGFTLSATDIISIAYNA